MSQKALKYMRIIICCALSVAVVAAGIMFATSCLGIYLSGERPFTTDSISAAFAKIDLPVYVCIGAVVIGGIAWLILPQDEKKPRAILDKRAAIARTEGKFELEKCSDEVIEKIGSAKKKERLLKIGTFALIIAFSIPAVIVALTNSRYTDDYNQSVRSICLLMLPWLALMLGAGVAYAYLEAWILDVRLKAAKNALAEAKASGNIKEYVKKDCGCRKKAFITRIIVIVITVGLLVLGITGGGMADVLSKAVNICTECIGLG